MSALEQLAQAILDNRVWLVKYGDNYHLDVNPERTPAPLPGEGGTP